MRLPRLVTVVACMTFAALQASDAEALHPTTPFQYWKDPCGYPPVVPTKYGASISRLLEAEALLIHESEIEIDPANSNFYRFKNPRDNKYWLNTTYELEPGAPFKNERQMGMAGRSGFLIAPNIIATAAHAGFDAKQFVVVFDLRSKPQPGSNPLVCDPPSEVQIPAANVYKPRNINPLIYDTMASDLSTYGGYKGTDYAAFYIDREAVGRRYLRIRKTGSVTSSDILSIASHPSRMRTKLIYGLTYAGDQIGPSPPGRSYPTFNDFYLWDGMSGAPVYNLDREYVEMVVGGPTGMGCAAALAPNSMYNPTSYMAIPDLCDDVPNSEDLAPSHGINNGPISELANAVPVPYLRVSPLDDVNYIVPINGAASPSQTIYTATASSSETVNTTIIASVDAAPAGEPQLLQISGFNNNLSPGTSTSITATATLPTGAACGIYSRFVNIIDSTHNFKDRIRHQFEVGMKDFQISPAGDQEIYAITAPSVPTKLSYTLTNTRPTPVAVVVTLDQTWAAVTTATIGAPGSPPTFFLTAQGTSGASKVIDIALKPNAYNLSDGDHSLNISFAAPGDCVLNPPISRNVTFHKGKLVLTQDIELFVPISNPPSPPVTSTITNPESFCTSNVVVKLDTAHVGDMIGSTLQQWVPHLSYGIDYTGVSPPKNVSLWANTALPTGWNIPGYYDDEVEAQIETLLLNRTTNLPPTGQSLSTFNAQNAQGQWTISIQDDGIQNRLPALLIRWSLEFEGSAGVCP